jgi:hypothetical protein
VLFCTRGLGKEIRSDSRGSGAWSGFRSVELRIGFGEASHAANLLKVEDALLFSRALA